MFCPQCKSEYVEGIAECVDCKVPLVSRPPAEPSHEARGFVRILATYNAADIAIIKSILDDAEIDYHFQGEVFNLMDPLIQPAVLYAPRDQEEDAREALRGVDLRYMGLTSRG
jgi:hypothetical protein